MNEKARQLGLTNTHFVRPDGLDAPGEYSTARDVARLAIDAMKVPIIRDTVRDKTATISGDRTLHTWNDPPRGPTRRVRSQDRPYERGRLVPGCGDPRPGRDDLRGHSRSPSEAQRDTDLEAMLEWGSTSYRVVDAISNVRVYAHVVLPYGKTPLALVARNSLLAVARVGLPLQERVVAPTAISLPVTAGEVLGRVSVYAGTKLVGQRPLVAARSVARPGVAGRVGFYAQRAAHNLMRAPPVIITVTLNAAFARTITVPNFQRGQRHRASPGLPLAGGKGINVARALKTSACPWWPQASRAARPVSGSSSA